VATAPPCRRSGSPLSLQPSRTATPKDRFCAHTSAFEPPNRHQSLIDSSNCVNIGAGEYHGISVAEPQGPCHPWLGSAGPAAYLAQPLLRVTGSMKRLAHRPVLKGECGLYYAQLSRATAVQGFASAQLPGSITICGRCSVRPYTRPPRAVPDWRIRSAGAAYALAPIPLALGRWRGVGNGEAATGTACYSYDDLPRFVPRPY
jgi:hypothetical protein